MSVQTEIDRIITAVQSAHEKVAEKGGTTAAPYLVANLASAIDSIPDATEPTLQSKIVIPKTSDQLITADSGYDGLSDVTVNAMPTATQATPSISVSSGGLITASATQSAGYVANGTKSATKQLTVQAAQTITPGTSNKTIASGRYLTGTQTIAGDSNLVADNIKSGVSIFGVDGAYEGSGGGGSAVIETGTFTTEDDQDLLNNPITISGLSGEPKLVYVYRTDGAQMTGDQYTGRLQAINSYDGYAIHLYRTTGSYLSSVRARAETNRYFLTLTSDGFTLSASSDEYTIEGEFSYIAVI